MNEIVSIIAVCVSVGTLVLSFFSQRRQARIDYVSTLEKRIQDLEKIVAEKDEKIRDLITKLDNAAEEYVRLLKSVATQIDKKQQ